MQTGEIDPGSDDSIETNGGDTSAFTRVTFPTTFPADSGVVVPAPVRRAVQKAVITQPEAVVVRVRSRGEGRIVRVGDGLDGVVEAVAASRNR
ncbi:hypothetical protein ACFFUA_17305 [Streptomyces heliomycini]|uniref:Uncharacterized protein n=1 Tax=Streptomyces heliomycini TaxID=284032 RepID=A0ABV5LCD8_9ACTN